MVRGFKSAVGKRMNETCNTPGAKVWQRNYFEHVIRDDEDYNCIAEYVVNNPQLWMEDSLHP
jgi:REP element-mobilizing transposase RayT